METARVPLRPDILEFDADGEVREAIAVEVACGDAPAELIVRSRFLGDAAGGLRPGLVARGGQPARRSVDHVDAPGLAAARDVFERRADSEVGIAVAIEIGARHRPSEVVPCLRTVGDPWRILGPELAGVRPQPAGRSI